jgi:hypothetical protein
MGAATIRNLEVRPWAIEPRAEGVLLRLGAERIALADIAAYEAAEHHERDLDGQVLGFSAYLLLACAFLLGVVVEGWRTRFLIAVALFVGIGLASGLEALQLKRIRVFRLRIAARSGRTLTFTTAREAEIKALVGALEAAGIARA